LHEWHNGAGNGAIPRLHRVNAVARHAAVKLGIDKDLPAEKTKRNVWQIEGRIESRNIANLRK
jgi:hypothetical protein